MYKYYVTFDRVTFTPNVNPGKVVSVTFPTLTLKSFDIQEIIRKIL